MALFPGTSPSGTLVDVADRPSRTAGIVTVGTIAEGVAVGNNVASPAQNTIIVDTGQLPAGTYRFTVYLDCVVAGNVVWEIQHRDAANAATLLSMILASFLAGINLPIVFTRTLALNERVRFTNSQAAFASTLSAWIMYERVK